MEARLMPCTSETQECLDFSLVISPPASVFSYEDFLGNTIHHFDIPGSHTELSITATSQVSVTPPEHSDYPCSWAAIDEAGKTQQNWRLLQPGTYVRNSPFVHQLEEELGVSRNADPFTTLKTLNSNLYNAFDYVPQSTQVDSTIDEVIATRRGVCQDFTHIMLALVRNLGIPCRYVSGYLFHRLESGDRSAEDATHAWMEAFLPDHGWIGFDPTNNLVATGRHIRVAAGRDYADVPPTRGVFRGVADQTLTVEVDVELVEENLTNSFVVTREYQSTDPYHMSQ